VNGTFTESVTEETAARLARAVELLCVRLSDLTLAAERIADPGDPDPDPPKILPIGAAPPRRKGRRV
jgi:hypothetical protein